MNNSFKIHNNIISVNQILDIQELLKIYCLFSKKILIYMKLNVIFFQELFLNIIFRVKNSEYISPPPSAAGIIELFYFRKVKE
jgi:hypothetical protein